MAPGRLILVRAEIDGAATREVRNFHAVSQTGVFSLWHGTCKPAPAEPVRTISGSPCSLLFKPIYILQEIP